MQKIEDIDKELEKHLKELHELQNNEEKLSEHKRGMLNYLHGVVKTLRWVRKNHNFSGIK